MLALNRVVGESYGDIDETVAHKMNECSKLAQKKYKTKPDCLGKAIHWELCKKFIFNYATKWYMHNPESIQESET